jgi:molybdopterin converting factor small subunit
MITVYIPTPLRPFTNEQAEIKLEGENVGEILEKFKAQFPDAAERFFSPRTARYFNLYLNDEDVRELGGMDTQVKAGDELAIVFAVAGG